MPAAEEDNFHIETRNVSIKHLEATLHELPQLRCRSKCDRIYQWRESPNCSILAEVKLEGTKFAFI